MFLGSARHSPALHCLSTIMATVNPPQPNPAGLDLANLASQLREDGVAFSDPAAADPVLDADIVGALAQVRGGERAGVVVVDAAPAGPAQLRDAAKDLQLETGLDTVIVRSPNLAIAVSGELTRAQVERGQAAMAVEPDYAAGVREFYGAADGFSVPWGVAGVLGVVAAAAVALASVRAARR